MTSGDNGYGGKEEREFASVHSHEYIHTNKHTHKQTLVHFQTSEKQTNFAYRSKIKEHTHANAYKFMNTHGKGSKLNLCTEMNSWTRVAKKKRFIAQINTLTFSQAWGGYRVTHTHTHTCRVQAKPHKIMHRQVRCVNTY